MTGNPFQTIDGQILADSGTSGEAATNLFVLCDRIGPRFAGTKGYRQAAEFMLGRFRNYGLDTAVLEPFTFTAWRRGAPTVFTMAEPFQRTYPCYALPYGAATGPDGIRAGLLDIGAGTSGDIEAKRGEIKGRMVLSDCTGAHRQEIYRKCAELGAAGFVFANPVEGMGLVSGSVANGSGGPIPAISIGCETAHQIRRLAWEDQVRFTLATHSTIEEDTTWNVVGELIGTEFPDELVIIGGHLDSHEIGPGAFDNAAGAVLVMEAARLLANQRQHLKRTVRFIGFAAEEIGLLGSRHHARKHADRLRHARFMLNCDTPSLGRPRGLAFHQCPEAEAYLNMFAKEIATPIVCQNRAHCYSDHYPFILQGLPTAGIGGGQFGPKIRHYGHMAADTPDKVSLTDLRDCAAFAARMIVRAANDQRWPRMRRTHAEVAEWEKKAQ